MANKPCIGMVTCSYCKAKFPVIWNGNFKINCFKCNKDVNVKRQKMKDVKLLNT